MFWLGSCPTNFHKIIENPNCNFAAHKYKKAYLLGRYASNRSLHRRVEHVLRHSNLLVTTSGFCNQLEKGCFGTSAGDRILGLKLNSINTEISLTEEKIQKVKTKC